MRRSIVFALLLATPLFSACSTFDDLLGSDNTAQQAEATRVRLDRMTQDFNSCAANRSAGEAIPHVAYALCVNRAFQIAMTDINYAHPDIVASLSAERLRVAEAADKGQISDAEGQARIADKVSEVIRLERARTASKHTEATPPQYFMQLLQTGL